MPKRGVKPAALKRHLINIVDLLAEVKLTYMVIGAFALPAWGRPRATLDLDILIQTPEIPEIFVRRLGDLGFHFDEEWDRYNPMIRAFTKGSVRVERLSISSSIEMRTTFRHFRVAKKNVSTVDISGSPRPRIFYFKN